MKQRNGSILFSPSDLNAFLECEHLTQLELADNGLVCLDCFLGWALGQ